MDYLADFVLAIVGGLIGSSIVILLKGGFS